MRHRPLPAAGEGEPLRFCPPEAIRSRYYLRFAMLDRPGTLARVATALGNHGIGIDSVIQHEAAPDAEYVPVILVTSAARAGELDAALAEIAAMDGAVQGDAVAYRIEDFE